MAQFKKVSNFFNVAILIILSIILTQQDDEEEPILTGTKCDLKKLFLVKFCEEDNVILKIIKTLKGDEKDVKLSEEKIDAHKNHQIVEKLMCYKVAYGCPKCSYWPRSFVSGNCPYCGLKLVKSVYWSPVAVIFDEKICIYSGIFPHVNE